MIDHPQTGIAVCWRPIFFDASVLIKLFLEEDGSTDARKVFQREAQIHTTWLCIGETYGRLKTEWKNGRLGADPYLMSLYLIQSWMIHGKLHLFSEMVQNREDFFRARQITIDHRVDFSDALLVLLVKQAITHDRWPADLTILATSDCSMRKIAEEDGIRVWDPATDSMLEPAPTASVESPGWE